jgi:prophage tail gpP-like protein
MNSIAGSFMVSIMNFFRGGTTTKDIKMGQNVTIEIDGQPVIIGWIERMPIRFGKDYDRMEILGRDKTCDLIDCSFDFMPNEWKRQTVYNIIQNLCKPFSIDVVLDSSVSSQGNLQVESFKANEGETVFEQIAELCRENAIMPLCLNDGKLTLTKATTNKYTIDALMTRVNIKAGYLDQNDENRYSSYKVKGYGIGTDDKSPTDYISCYGNFSDTLIKRTKPIVIFSDTSTTISQCQNRAKWEARVRAGLSRKVIYDIQGWTQSDGKMWDINKLVKIDDQFTGYKTTMLISDVNYLYSEDIGEITQLTLVDKDTYNLSDNAINIKSKYD